MNSYVSFADLLGLGRLALDGARVITDTVEDVHATIAAPFSPCTTPGTGRTGGIAGLVYRSIHAGYDVAGVGVQAALDTVTRVRATPAGTLTRTPAGLTPERETLMAILNGVWGDHLAASGNPLAIQLSLRHGGVPLVVDAASIRVAIPTPGNRLLVLVHGLCMNELGWRQGSHDHGAELARDLGYTALYLRYNSGQHVSTNGKRLAGLLERLIAEWPEPVEELVILGYSMGGLVARSAMHYGVAGEHRWLDHLRGAVFLGTPHHGSRLERAGNWADTLLNSTRYSAPFRRLGTTRSAGITDLRHGSVVDEDWQGRDRFIHRQDTRCPAPLPAGVQCYTLAATIGRRAGDAKDRLLGDGIVPLASALGAHRNPDYSLAFPESNQWVGYGMDHKALLSNADVYAQIRRWLES